MPVISGSLGTKGLCDYEPVEFVFYRQMMKNQHHLEIKSPDSTLKILDLNLLYLHHLSSALSESEDEEKSGDIYRLFYWDEERETIESKVVSGVPNTLIQIYRTKKHEVPLHVLMSPISGSHSAASIFEKTIKPFLVSTDIQYLQCTLDSMSSMKRYIEETNFHEERPLFMLLSGDGVFHDLLNCYEAGEFDVCLIPCGTANALASSVGIYSIRDGIRAFTVGVKRNLTPLCVTLYGSWQETIKAGVVVSWGFHAQIVSQSENLRDHVGINRFKVIAHKLLGENNVYKGVVSTDSKRLCDTKYLLISRVPRLETMFIPCPTAKLDGPFKVLHISSSGDVEQKLREAYHGGIIESDGVSVITTDKVTVEIQDKMDEVCIDGYIIKAQKIVVQLDKVTIGILGFAS
ncbi:Sphingosine kinase 1 [Neolecta irregularis DAH-3]|uniref:Sphingosine kinase 1 n=1 Tax=Neolecta irregularis (strain DAH-3) TaxID=1198029 RepID=A0A1U7LQL4_NEOID|nr:Sphingosine kinase 1 [Neolecta irregularis DAH-3]|eukprot:OLL24873.1 Sphingosine kinase 1 [Neolecta irregularis DAH-3]